MSQLPILSKSDLQKYISSFLLFLTFLCFTVPSLSGKSINQQEKSVARNDFRALRFKEVSHLYKTSENFSAVAEDDHKRDRNFASNFLLPNFSENKSRPVRNLFMQNPLEAHCLVKILCLPDFLSDLFNAEYKFSQNNIENNQIANNGGRLGKFENNGFTSAIFANSNLISIPAANSAVNGGGAANPYSSNITVSGLSGTITDLNVKINGFSHTFPNDVAMLLVSPGGEKFILQSDVGGKADVNNISYIFDDQASATIGSGGPFPANNTSVKPSSVGNDDILPAPAPNPPYQQPAPAASATLNGVFGGLSPNGTWQLFVFDFFAGNSGSITGGWSLDIATTGGAVVSPSITALSPNSLVVGGTSFELVVSGSNFSSDSVVRWNGQNRATTFVSNLQVKAQIASSNITNAGSYPITVINTLSGRVSNAVNFSVTGCSYSINSSSQTIPVAGGNGSINVSTTSGCAWTAASNNSWITITSGGGSGTGTVNFSVASNTGPARTGTITVGGQTFSVNQGNGCAYTLSSTSTTIPVAGGSGSVGVSAGNGCTWTAASNTSWLSVTSGASGTGEGTTAFSVAGNSGMARTGTLTIGGQTLTISQGSGCTFTMSPSSIIVPINGTVESFAVNASSTNCTWTPTTVDSWITIMYPENITGNGTMQFSVAANTGPARTGIIRIGEETLVITQNSGCLYSLSAAAANIPASGGTANFNITSSNGCPWTAVSNNSWITLTSSANGSGSSSISFSLAANIGTIRTGSITAAGQTFTVNQAGFTAPASGSVLYDFDGDRKADISVYRPSSGVWHLLRSQSGYTSVQFGVSTDKLVPADYDGDGKTDIAVWREDAANSNFSYFHIWKSSDSTVQVEQFGSFGDSPTATGDWDGDGKADLSVYRKGVNNAQSYFFYRPSAHPEVNFITISWGLGTDKAAAADFDGDGKMDAAVFRPSSGVWYILKSSGSYSAIAFGTAGDKLVVGDYDGDGKADQAVFRPSNGVWYIQQSSAGFAAAQFGIATDVPVPADYDGDGKTDIGVYRQGVWYLLNSSSGFSVLQFGVTTDNPVLNSSAP